MAECFKEGLYWRGLAHDMSKFLPSEFFSYADYCFGHSDDIKQPECDNGYSDNYCVLDAKFNFAWLLHKKRNKHHWQWWVEFDINDGVMALEMGEPYLTEMICDWVGAGKAQGYMSPKEDRYFEVRKWYAAHRDKMKLNERTRSKVEERIKWIS